MTTAQQVIEAGYSRSTANDAGKLAIDAELLGFLNRKFQAYYALAASSNPDSFLSKASVTLAGADVTATLPTDLIGLLRAEYTSSVGSVYAAGTKVNIIPAIERDRAWHLLPAVFRRGSSIFSPKRSGDPIAGDVITLDVLDAPATLAAVSTALDARWPVRYDELLILDIAVYLSAKDEGRDPGDFQKLSAERAAHLEIFLKLNGVTTTGRESPHMAAVRNRGDN